VSDVGVIKIENRGKNLAILNSFTPVADTTFIIDNSDIIVTNTSGSYRYVTTNTIPLKQNTTYTLSATIETIFGADSGFIRVTAPDGSALAFLTSSGSVSFNSHNNTYCTLYLYASRNTNAPQSKRYSYIQLEEGASATPYEPPRSDYLEFSQELFGYAGVFDELHDDGTLIKRWQKETGRTVTLGSASVTKSGTGTCILVNETNGEVYEGTVSGTSVSTSATDGTYTLIYQLATPEISTVSFSGSGLILDKGDNNIILPDYGVMELEYEGTGTSQESLIYMQDLRIREEATYREYQPVNSQYTKSIQTGKKYSISIGQVYFERSMADKLDKDTRFTLEVNKENEDGRTETDRYVNCRLNSVEETDSNGLRMESVDITAEAKEVVA
jgi:hypothetical protein